MSEIFLMSKLRYVGSVLVVTGFWLLSGCDYKVAERKATAADTAAVAHIEHPDWSKSANIYEVNIRQYTPEGTFSAFQKELPRLKKMGVDILWLMPIHPIGEKNRKGKLGSYYSIRDYTAVNPDFGTKQDFIDLVREVHRQDMKLILDWVPNHTAWDHPWISEHPEYYMRDSLGNITYEADWTDIAQLNYENRELWDQMIQKMKFWIKEASIDGYRVDHAGHDIPLAFWKKAIPEVNKVGKEIFWLAEWNTPEMHPWFDATYTWEYFHLTTEIAKGEEPLHSIPEYMRTQESLFSDHAYRLYFTTNHDENSWNGSDRQLFGRNFENFAVMAATIGGMPLVYSGQETGLEQQLKFFEKDTIAWDDYEYERLYRKLFELKDRNKALWNGQYGGEFQHVPTNEPDHVLAFKRQKGDSEVLVLLNMDNRTQQIRLNDVNASTEYRDLMTGKRLMIGPHKISLGAHSFLVLEK